MLVLLNIREKRSLRNSENKANSGSVTRFANTMDVWRSFNTFSQEIVRFLFTNHQTLSDTRSSNLTLILQQFVSDYVLKRIFESFQTIYHQN